MSTTQTLQNKNTNQPVYPNCPQRITFAYNLVVNSNGAQFHEGQYKWSDEQEYSGYAFRAFQYSDNSYVTDMDEIKEYLSFMIGSDFVPEYNRDNPHDVFIFTQADNQPWKYQLTNIGGADILCAFKVNNFPFATKSDVIDQSLISIDGTVNGGIAHAQATYGLSRSQLKIKTFCVEHPEYLDIHEDTIYAISISGGMQEDSIHETGNIEYFKISLSGLVRPIAADDSPYCAPQVIAGKLFVPVEGYPSDWIDIKAEVVPEKMYDDPTCWGFALYIDIPTEVEGVVGDHYSENTTDSGIFTYKRIAHVDRG